MASINCSITRQNQLMLFKELTRYMNLAESQLFKLTITWPAAYDTQWAFKPFVLCSIQVDKWFCYIAGNFFPAAFTLIGTSRSLDS